MKELMNSQYQDGTLLPQGYTHTPLVQQIKDRVVHHEQALERLRTLQALLEKNPDIARFVDLSRGLI